MKIERNPNQTVNFGSIEAGEVITNPEENIPIMKIDEVIDDGCEIICNAINLTTGTALYIDDDQDVIRLNAKLVIT